MKKLSFTQWLSIFAFVCCVIRSMTVSAGTGDIGSGGGERPGTSNITIQCGDTQKDYVHLDLSPQFHKIFLSGPQVQRYQDLGFKELYGARNCFASGTDQEYQIAIMARTHRFLARDLLAQFGIVPAVLTIRTTIQDLESGLVLFGPKEMLENATQGTQATLDSDRVVEAEDLVVFILKSP